MIKTDVCIVGAGPGGAATALKFSHLGISSVLVDKSVFPRDKVCGDAISGKAITVLRRIDPRIVDRFEADARIQTDIWGIRFVAPNTREIDVPFRVNYDKNTEPKQGFVSKRVDFDNLLIDEVRKRPDIRFFENTSIDNFERTANGYRISDRSGDFTAEARILIVANGAHSNFSRHHAGLEKDPRHHAGAVRAYYRNVAGMHPDGFIELHFLKKIIPGYLWIFPLPGGYANVGLGMRSDVVSNRRFNLTKSLEEIIASHPHLRSRFESAERLGRIVGYGLPLGSKKRSLSGDHYMLIGDAGHLIDPLSGEGIGNAIYSGVIAAEQAVKCFEAGDFSAGFMRAYDERVERVLGREMQLSYRLQRLMNRPWLVNMTANWVSRNRTLLDLLSLMYSDLEVRKKSMNPFFWLKVLLGKVRTADLVNGKQMPEEPEAVQESEMASR